MPKITFHPFPDLKTERLDLRQLFLADQDDLLDLRDHPEVLKYIDRPKTVDLVGARDFIRFINNGIAKQKWFYWGITLSGHPQIIGTICLWQFNEAHTETELGYELHPDFQGKGIMQEAVRATLNFAFDVLNLQKINAFTHFENTPSTKLLKKYGFSFIKESGKYSLFQLGNDGS